MKKIINAMIENKMLSTMILIFIFFFGIVTMQSMKREQFPSVNLNIVTITTTYPGAAPEDVELNVTVPIERELRSVSGIDEIKSTSTENRSVITIQVDDNLNEAAFQKVLDDIKSAVDRVDNLPDQLDGRPIVQELDVEKFPIVEVALFGDKKILRPLAKSLEIQMRTIPGIATIEKIGYFDTEIHVELNPWLMQKHYISFDEVINSIRSRNIRSSGGSIDSYIGKQSIVTLSKFQNPTEIKKVILRSNFEERRILLGDVAKIHVTEEDTKLQVRSNGKEGISLVVTKKPSADIVTTVNSSRTFFKNQKLPKGVEYTLLNDGSNSTKKTISSLASNGVIGIILVMIVLMLFLNIRTASWCAFSIPFSLAMAFALMPFFGMTINMVSMTGFLIVLGMLVDDAIVTAEHIEHLIEKGTPPKEAALKGAVSMVQPITAAVLTTIVGYLPLFFLGGKAGKFIWPIPIVVSLALLASLFDTFLLLPGHLAHRPKKKQKSKAKWVLKIEHSYKKMLHGVLKKRKIFTAASIAFLFFTFFFAGNNLKIIMFPTSGTDVFYIKYETPIGSSIKRTAKEVIRVEKTIASIKKEHGEIISFTSRVGHMNTQGANKNRGDHENWAITTVYLTHPDKRKRSANDIIKALRKRVKVNKHTRITFEAKKRGPSSAKPVQVVVMGNNKKDRDKTVIKLINFLKKIKGVYDIDRDDKDGKKQLVIKLNYRKLAAYNLTTADVASLLKIAFDGRKVTSIQTLDEEIWYRVILAPQFRGKKGSIKHLKVRNKTGQLISLDRLVRLEVKTAKQDLYHFDGMQAVTVTAEVDNKAATSLSVSTLMEKDFLAKWTPPLGTIIQISGEAKESKDTIKDFGVALAIAICAIFFIVALVLKNLAQTGIVLGIIPFAFIGVSWALYLHGLPFSLFSIMGMLGLAGIVVNDSIVMIDQLNKNIEKSKATIDDIVENAAHRLRPILMTTLTTVGGLLPAAYGLGGSDAFVVQLSVSVGYGLMFCSLMTLFLVPSLYWGNCRKAQRKAAKIAAKKKRPLKKNRVSAGTFFGDLATNTNGGKGK